MPSVALLCPWRIGNEDLNQQIRVWCHCNIFKQKFATSDVLHWFCSPTLSPTFGVFLFIWSWQSHMSLQWVDRNTWGNIWASAGSYLNRREQLVQLTCYVLWSGSDYFVTVEHKETNLRQSQFRAHTSRIWVDPILLVLSRVLINRVAGYYAIRSAPWIRRLWIN